jgi:TPR repeat protein
VHLVPGRNLLDCLVAPERIQRHFRLEFRRELPSLRHLCIPPLSGGIHLSNLSDFPGPPQYDLGRLYERGRGVEKNIAEAIKLFQQAVSQSHLPAMARLGLMYRDGKGVKRNYAKSFELFAQSAAKKYNNSYLYLGMSYLGGWGTAADQRKAFEAVKVAVKKNPKRSVNVLKAEARKGIGPALFILGRLYEEGNGVARNAAHAKQYYDLAAKHGFTGK